MSGAKFSRRDFMKVSGIGTAGFVFGEPACTEAPTSAVPPPMPVRPLGRTGHSVRLFSLGGQATIEQPGTDAESDAIINRAIDLGVNYIDTAASYGGGISQRYIGRVMATRRGNSPQLARARRFPTWQRSARDAAGRDRALAAEVYRAVARDL